MNEDTLSTLTSLGKNAKLKRPKQSGARREAFQSRSTGKNIAIPGTRPTRPKEPLWWRRLELPQRQRTQTEWNNTCTEMGDAQLTRTTSGIISLERNDIRRNRQVIPDGNAPMMRRKFALARITETCCMLAANVCKTSACRRSAEQSASQLVYDTNN